MAYQIGDEIFATKNDIRLRCQQILHTSFEVADEDVAFLLQLFQHHEQWPEKSRGGVQSVRVYPSSQGTPCFNLVCTNGNIVDISYPHSIKCVPSNRSARRQPQWLTDYKSAARQTIKPQINSFRDGELPKNLICPITGEAVTATNGHVDHIAPLTFDQLLCTFTAKRRIDPSTVEVGSQGGTVPFFLDASLAEAWSKYHQRHAQLRLISQAGNLGLPKPRIDWGL